jgi:hypothetical protein
MATRHPYDAAYGANVVLPSGRLRTAEELGFSPGSRAGMRAPSLSMFEEGQIRSTYERPSDSSFPDETQFIDSDQ